MMTILEESNTANIKLVNFLRCKSCEQKLILEEKKLFCYKCGKTYYCHNNIYRFIDGEYHSNFGIQWNTFPTVQLDSFNGSNESESRLLNQSQLNPTDFKNKLILEVGSGNGRFTELFLKYGAKVIAIDYSTAIDANLKNHMKNYQQGNFLPLQADLFELPLSSGSFDMVFCYGVIQHTGDNLRALKSIAKYVNKDGKLFVDIYAISFIHFNPFIYLMRFILQKFKISDLARLKFVKSFVKFIFPFQVHILTYLYKKRGLLNYIRYIINRSPNSVYGINLWLDGKISKKCAYDWCILDTFDAWAPKHDHPVTSHQWNDLLNLIVDTGFLIEKVGSSGQGYTAILRRSSSIEK